MIDVLPRIPSQNSHSLSMDAELKTYLDDRDARMVQLLIDIKESLERQISQMNQRFDAVDARFDAQANRLDRQAAFIQSGARWSNRMTTWSEKIDVALDKKSQEIIDLNKRIDKKQDGAK
jgi:hypothetical protein